MSDVEEYRKRKVYLAEACGAGTLEDLADAAIAELEAELERANRRKANTEWNAMVRQSDENLARAEQAEAALETLAERDRTLRLAGEQCDFPCTYCRGMAQHDPTCQLLVIRVLADIRARVDLDARAQKP